MRCRAARRSKWHAPRSARATSLTIPRRLSAAAEPASSERLTREADDELVDGNRRLQRGEVLDGVGNVVGRDALHRTERSGSEALAKARVDVAEQLGLDRARLHDAH